MKAFCNFLKFVAVLAAIAGAVYVAITYGDKIVAWFKAQFGKYCCCGCSCEEAPAVVEEAAAEEPVAEASEADFEG